MRTILVCTIGIRTSYLLDYFKIKNKNRYNLFYLIIDVGYDLFLNYDAIVDNITKHRPCYSLESLYLDIKELV